MTVPEGKAETLLPGQAGSRKVFITVWFALLERHFNEPRTFCHYWFGATLSEGASVLDHFKATCQHGPTELIHLQVPGRLWLTMGRSQ